MKNDISVEENNVQTKHDIGGMVCAALFILIGMACLYETTLMIDPDSYMFPRLVIIGLIGLSIVLFVTSLLKPSSRVIVETESDERLSSTRRILLVTSMMGSTLLMPWIGFLLSGLVAFIALMLLAQYDPWTKAKLLLYSVVSLAIVCGFFGVFSYLLNVPLPEGLLIPFS